MRKKYDKEELNIIGSYADVDTDAFAACNMDYLPGGDKYNYPITARENFLMALRGEKPYWIPFHGISNCDTKVFLPRMNQDFVVRHTIMDGEPRYPYDTTVMTSNWFDLEWEYVEAVGGATVHPGNPKVPDMSEWESYVSVPNIAMFDFDDCKRKNAQFFESEKMNETAIFTGYWERLMSLMDVENAAIAIIDEDQKEGIHRMFNQLTDFYCDYASKMKEAFPMLEMIQIHDDWGHQNSIFFSPDTAREMLLPYLKRFVEHCHSIGLFVELHSCGKNAKLVPLFIEAEIDLWCPQQINNIAEFVEQYKNEKLFFGVPEPQIPEDANEETIKTLAKEWVDYYKNYNVVCSFMAAPVSFRNAVYEYSRLAFEESNE